MSQEPGPSPHQRNTSGSSFSQRLGYYLVGVAIGLVALGFLWTNRQKAAQAQQQSQQAGAPPAGQQAAPAGGDAAP